MLNTMKIWVLVGLGILVGASSTATFPAIAQLVSWDGGTPSCQKMLTAIVRFAETGNNLHRAGDNLIQMPATVTNGHDGRDVVLTSLGGSLMLWQTQLTGPGLQPDTFIVYDGR